MNSTPTLDGSHLRTYHTLFQHPITHNLEWHAVRGLLEQLGRVTEEHNGNLKVTRNGHTLVLRRPHTKDVAETDEVMTLRHFLRQSETPPPETNKKVAHWLLVIDHRQARIFRSEIHGGIPTRILPEEYLRLSHDTEELVRGREKPEPASFFGPVAKALQTGGQILIFGSGTGSSCEMDEFLAWLKPHHPELAARVIGSLVVDQHHLSDDELLAKAREFYQDATSTVGSQA